jgi:hypothetical protein
MAKLLMPITGTSAIFAQAISNSIKVNGARQKP